MTKDSSSKEEHKPKDAPYETLIASIQDLSSVQLLELNKEVADLFKKKKLQENAAASTNFDLGDIVSFEYKDKTHYAMVLTASPKKIALITTEDQRVDVEPRRLTKCSKIPKKALDLRKAHFGDLFDAKPKKG